MAGWRCREAELMAPPVVVDGLVACATAAVWRVWRSVGMPCRACWVWIMRRWCSDAGVMELCAGSSCGQIDQSA